MTSKYSEAAAIVMFESGAVALTINDDRLLSDPQFAVALQHVEAAASSLKAARMSLVQA